MKPLEKRNRVLYAEKLPLDALANKPFSLFVRTLKQTLKKLKADYSEDDVEIVFDYCFGGYEVKVIKTETDTEYNQRKEKLIAENYLEIAELEHRISELKAENSVIEASDGTVNKGDK